MEREQVGAPYLILIACLSQFQQNSANPELALSPVPVLVYAARYALESVHPNVRCCVCSCLSKGRPILQHGS